MDLSLANNYLDELKNEYKSATDEDELNRVISRMKQINKIISDDYKIIAEREVCRIMQKPPSIKLIRLEQTRRAKLFEITGQNL
jgi:hypothetical protein